MVENYFSVRALSKFFGVRLYSLGHSSQCPQKQSSPIPALIHSLQQDIAADLIADSLGA
jgi:hypothetical protein